MTKAERYKRNYGLIRNMYQNSTLAKKYQTYSDENIYKELGVDVSGKTTPRLRKIDKDKQGYYNRKLDKYVYARSIGIQPDKARKLTTYKKEKIESSGEYYDAASKQFNYANKNRRIALWKKWSKRNLDKQGRFDRTKSSMPPNVEATARKYNRQSMVGYKQRDDYDAFGYVVAFYMFVENKTYEQNNHNIR